MKITHIIFIMCFLQIAFVLGLFLSVDRSIHLEKELKEIQISLADTVSARDNTLIFKEGSYSYYITGSQIAGNFIYFNTKSCNADECEKMLIFFGKDVIGTHGIDRQGPFYDFTNEKTQELSDQLSRNRLAKKILEKLKLQASSIESDQLHRSLLFFLPLTSPFLLQKLIRTPRLNHFFCNLPSLLPHVVKHR